MRTVSTAPLGSLVNIVGGGTPSKSRPEFFEGAIPWVTPKDMKVWTILDSEDHISEEAVAASPAKLVPKGTVLVVVRSGVLKHTLPVAIAGRPVTLNQDMKGLLCGDDIDSRFLAFFLKSAEPRLLTTVRGTTADNIPLDELKALEVPRLPLTEQRRIADILDKADAIRRKRKEAIALTEELLRSAFLEMFGDPVTNPKGWPCAPLSSFGKLTTGNTPSRSNLDFFGDAIEWIKSDNINTTSHLLTPAAEGLSESGRRVGRVVPAGSTLMTCIAGSPECIGNVGLADREVAFNQQINALTPWPDTDPRFVYTMLLIGKPLVQAASTASMKGMVSKGRLETIMFPTPPRSEQLRFGSAFDRLLALQRQAMRACDEANASFASLSSQLLRFASAPKEQQVVVC